MRVVLAGLGIAGKSFLDCLEKAQDDLQLFLVEKDTRPFKRYLFFDWLIDKVSDDDFFIGFEDLVNKFPSLEIISDKALRVNFDKKKIFFKEKEALDFDKLILACGTKHKRLEFPGVFKEGIYYMGDSSLINLKQTLRIFNNIILYLETFLGLELALRLASFPGKEIKIVVDNLDFIPLDYRQKLLDLFKQKGIDVYFNQTIVEVMGESRVKAAKISSVKFLACDILILDTMLSANTDLVKDNPSFFNNATLDIGQYLNTNLDFCYSCGDMINLRLGSQRFLVNNREIASQQGDIVAANIWQNARSFCFPQQESEVKVLDNFFNNYIQSAESTQDLP